MCFTLLYGSYQKEVYHQLTSTHMTMYKMYSFQVIGSTRDASMQDKENMPYVTATINEIQRMASIGNLVLKSKL